MNNLHKQVEGICLVLCQPFPLLLPPKRMPFFFFCENPKTNLHIGETDGRQGETESPIQKSHCDGNGGCHGNREVEQFAGFPREDMVVT